MTYNNPDILGKRVQVYRNLRKKCYSVQYNRKVVSHEDQIFMILAKFKVSEAGRKRVLREKQKNVHAKVEGIVYPMMPFDKLNKGDLDMVYYNPYECETFERIHSEQEYLEGIETAGFVWLTKKGVYVPSHAIEEPLTEEE